MRAVIIIQSIILILSNENYLLNSTEIRFYNCKDNPMLYLINIPTFIDSLYDTPTQEIYNYCNLQNTCCSSNSYKILLGHMQTDVITAKTNTFEQNLKFFGLTINEHSRNFINGFNIDSADFDRLFLKYRSLIDDLYMIVKDIVYKTVRYQWDSYCEYICNPHALDDCQVYNNTYMLNDTIAYNLTYHCEVYPDRVSNIKSDIYSYISKIKSLNETLDSLYSEIIDTSNRTLTPTNMTLLLNSLYDGQIVSKSYTQNFICKDEDLCTEAVNVLCSLISCQDDIFMTTYQNNSFTTNNAINIVYSNTSSYPRINDKDEVINSYLSSYQFSDENVYYSPFKLIILYSLFILF
jgi:hypothetical protein